jgi:hypothetical protein
MVGEGAAASIDDTHDSPGPLSSRAGLFVFRAFALPIFPLVPTTTTRRRSSLPTDSCMRMPTSMSMCMSMCMRARLCAGVCMCPRLSAADRE